MTTQPGVLPPNVEKLRFERLPKHIKTIIEQLGQRMLVLEQKIIDEAKQQKKQIEVLDKTELSKLNQGAEDTSTDEEDDSDEDVKPARGISSSMQRSIDRLLKSSEKKDKN